MKLVRWATAHARGRCAECSARIVFGDHVAHYIERVPVWGDSRLEFGTRAIHIRRRYCEPCGELLQDSLTTTETLREKAS